MVFVNGRNAGGVHHPPGRQLRQRGARHQGGPSRVQQPQEEHHVHTVPHRTRGGVVTSAR